MQNFQYTFETLKRSFISIFLFVLYDCTFKLKAFLRNKNVQKQETELANKEPNIKSKTNWESKKNHHTVETFIEAVNKDIVERFSDTKKLPKNNLTDTDKNTIEYFSKRNDLVITEADKGGATVILDVKKLYCKG